jgi:hypothetical protein
VELTGVADLLHFEPNFEFKRPTGVVLATFKNLRIDTEGRVWVTLNTEDRDIRSCLLNSGNKTWDFPTGMSVDCSYIQETRDATQASGF